jgi:hypothetical protein
VGDALLGLSAAVTQYVFAGFFVAIAFKPSLYVSNPAPGARAIGLAFALATYALGRWGRRRIRRAAREDYGLTVMPDRLVVSHEDLLSEPVTIPRERVELVAIDDGTAGGELRRRRSLPVLDTSSRRPNLMLSFTEPVDFPARHKRLEAAHPLPGLMELGLLVRVTDPSAAARAFDGWRRAA